MRNVERLCLAHFWVAFAAFLVACLLGAWQMWVRSPLGADVGTPGQYFMSVTAHGVSMADVLTTFFIMGFGYFVAVTSLNRPLPGKAWAWAAFWIAIVGVVMAVIPILMGKASVLFTFYPPLMASPWFYIGLVLVVAGSWIWCVLMLVAMRDWKRENPGQPVPLAMFATVANAVMWLWTTVGVAADWFFKSSRRHSAWCRPSMPVWPARCSRGRSTLLSISGSYRRTSRSIRWCRARPAAGSTATPWAASRSFCF